MTTKLHINLQQGILEVEGGETFVREMYEDFKTELRPIYESKPKTGRSAAAGTSKQASTSKGKTPSKGTRPKKEDLKVDKTLDLSGVSGAVSLKDYVKKYGPKSNMDRNVVFVDYLKEQLHIEDVTIEQVWTCYSDLGLKLPVDMPSSIIDTGRAAGKHRLNTGSLQDLSLSVQGKNWLLEQSSQGAAA